MRYGYEQRADNLTRRLKDDGFDPDLRHYPPRAGDDLDRWYVSVRPDPVGPTYSVQYHQESALGGSVQTSNDQATTKPHDPEFVARFERARQAVSS